MFFRPIFIKTDEDWVIWLLAEEFHETATPEMLIERTNLLPDQVDEVLRNLERIKAIKAIRDKGPIRTIHIAPYGWRRYEELKSRQSDNG